jgi:hypothetical protein
MAARPDAWAVSRWTWISLAPPAMAFCKPALEKNRSGKAPVSSAARMRPPPSSRRDTASTTASSKRGRASAEPGRPSGKTEKRYRRPLAPRQCRNRLDTALPARLASGVSPELGLPSAGREAAAAGRERALRADGVTVVLVLVRMRTNIELRVRHGQSVERCFPARNEVSRPEPLCPAHGTQAPGQLRRPRPRGRRSRPRSGRAAACGRPSGRVRAGSAAGIRSRWCRGGE